MTVTPTSFKVRFPEFASIDDSRIQLFLDDAEIIINESYWGTKYDLGISYYTAHELTRAINSEASGTSGGGGGGAITSKSVDGVSISYSSKTPDDTKEYYYSSTSYGLKYWALLKSLPIAAASI